MQDIAVYDHLRSTDPDEDDAIYRVVGLASSHITLLRVSDADGRRANTGEVITVSRDALDTFESAENPDGNRTVVATLRGAYWSLRAVVGSLTANPVPSVVAIALVVAGSTTAGPVSGPLSTGLLFAGMFMLVYVGSGRF